MRTLLFALAAMLLGGCAGQPPADTASPAPKVAPPAAQATPAATARVADGPIALPNAGFDTAMGPGATCPPGWACSAHVNPAAFAYSIVADPATGNRFLRIARVKPEPWGMATQPLVARAFAGKRLSLSLKLNTERLEGAAGPIILLQGPGGRVQGHRQVLEKAAQGWRTVKAEIDVPAGIELVEIGILQEGGGTVDVDDVSLSVSTPGPA